MYFRKSQSTWNHDHYDSTVAWLYTSFKVTNDIDLVTTLHRCTVVHLELSAMYTVARSNFILCIVEIRATDC